jgi:hypothetical protein
MNLRIDYYLMILFILPKYEEDQEVYLERGSVVGNISVGIQAKSEAQSISSLSPSWTLGAACTKIIARSHINVFHVLDMHRELRR